MDTTNWSGSLSSEIRNGVGGPSEARLSNTVITESIEAARREYSKYRGPRAIAFFTTVANQAEYDYDPTVVASIVDVMSLGSGGATESFDMEVGGKTFSLTDNELSEFDHPSTGYITAYKRQIRADSGRGSWESTGSKVVLIPAPREAARKVYYQYRSMMTLDQIPEIDRALFKLFAEACCLEHLALRAAVTPAVQGSGSNTNIDALERAAKSRRSQFFARVQSAHR